MRSQGQMAGIVVVVALVLMAGVVATGDLLAAGPTPAPITRLMKYRLPQQALSGLPTALQLEPLKQRFAAGAGPKGIQYFQSPAGLSGMFFHPGEAAPGTSLFFLLRNEWTFLPDKGFEQHDARGNHLTVYDGKAQVFNSAGLQIGAFADPSLGPLYSALLKLTM